MTWFGFPFLFRLRLRLRFWFRFPFLLRFRFRLRFRFWYWPLRWSLGQRRWLLSWLFKPSLLAADSRANRPELLKTHRENCSGWQSTELMLVTWARWRRDSSLSLCSSASTELPSCFSRCCYKRTSHYTHIHRVLQDSPVPPL